MEPLGTRTRNGLCTGQEVRGPQRDEAACCKDSAELQGLNSAGGGGQGGADMLSELRPLMLRQCPDSMATSAAEHWAEMGIPWPLLPTPLPLMPLLPLLPPPPPPKRDMCEPQPPDINDCDVSP